MNRTPIVTVRDLDCLTERYEVRDAEGYALGEKFGRGDYRKPSRDKRGRRNYGKWASIEDRQYKTKPPWFNASVQRIVVVAGIVQFRVEKRVVDEE